MAEQYIYAVTRLHAHEHTLLSAKDIEALAAAQNAAEAIRLLNDKGWETQPADALNPSPLLQRELDGTWALIAELVGDLTPFNMFRYDKDFHNLKAAIKLEYTAEAGGEDADRYFVRGGTIALDTIQKAAKSHDFTALPDNMAAAGREAYEALAHTGNGQSCDMVIDRAALLAIGEAGQKTESALLREYAALTVDLANIKAAIRCCRMGKDSGFIERAVAPAGTLDTRALVDAAASSESAVYAYLRLTRYSGAVDALEQSMAAFELWASNRMIEMIRPQRNNYFSIEPLAAYILARENEVAMVRIILSAKINGLSGDILRERLREMYV